MHANMHARKENDMSLIITNQEPDEEALRTIAGHAERVASLPELFALEKDTERQIALHPYNGLTKAVVREKARNGDKEATRLRHLDDYLSTIESIINETYWRIDREEQANKAEYVPKSTM